MIVRRIRYGVSVGITSSVLVGMLAGLAAVTDQPFIFPSLGATIYLLLTAPGTPAASVRSTLIGHALGAGAGLMALAVFGLRSDPTATAETLGASRVGAVAMALGLTCGLMVVFGVGHPPAGATTLIVSLGFLHTIEQVAILMVAVGIVALVASTVQRWLVMANSPTTLVSSPSAERL